MATKVHGEAALRRKLKKLEKQVPDALVKALFEEAMGIFTESQEQVPVDTGRLQDSGVVGRLQNQLGVVVAYGTNYALPVHERTEVPHLTGKAKYLEDPFNEAQKGMQRRLISRTRRLARGLL